MENILKTDDRGIIESLGNKISGENDNITSPVDLSNRGLEAETNMGVSAPMMSPLPLPPMTSLRNRRALYEPETEIQDFVLVDVHGFCQGEINSNTECWTTPQIGLVFSLVIAWNL